MVVMQSLTWHWNQCLDVEGLANVATWIVMIRSIAVYPLLLLYIWAVVFELVYGRQILTHNVCALYERKRGCWQECVL